MIRRVMLEGVPRQDAVALPSNTGPADQGHHPFPRSEEAQVKELEAYKTGTTNRATTARPELKRILSMGKTNRLGNSKALKPYHRMPPESVREPQKGTNPILSPKAGQTSGVIARRASVGVANV